MKKLLITMLTLLLIAGLSVTVFADVIWVPENDFLYDHMEECQRTDRAYRALTEVKVYETPESGKVLWTVPAGESCWIYYTYEDANGNLWGCIDVLQDQSAGWLPLAYTELVYDYISFNEDYGHTFLTLDKAGQFPEEYRDEVVMFWAYPGSESCAEFDMGAWADSYFPEYDTVYEDPQGRRWGYVGYYMGHRNFWIFLDNPTADFATLFPDGAPQVEVTEPGETTPTLPAEEIKPITPPIPMGATVAVIACVAVTAFILVKMKKKSK